ncbi:MAG TPA: hypothetical protein VFP61_15880 [Acidimicrobiales bacterium]|nr:hypothetical protein [Acidimicrobiales bacterium]
MHDLITFERLGIPTAVVITDPFIATAHAIAELDGMTDYRPLVAPHPITSRSDAELLALSRELAAGVEAVLLGAPTTSPMVAAPAAGPAAAVTVAAVEEVLRPYAAGLQTDGADLRVEVHDDTGVAVTLVVTDETCLDCIMPGDTIRDIVARLLADRFGHPVPVVVHDPRPGGGL